MAIVYDRAENSLTIAPGPMGTFGQISMRRLCDVLEKCGEIGAHERITHLIISDDMIKYRIAFRPASHSLTEADNG